jgi:hypothetical protein
MENSFLVRQLVLEQEPLLHLLRLQPLQLLQSDTHHPPSLAFLLVTTALQGGQADVLLAETAHAHVTCLLEDATSTQVVLAPLHALPGSALLLFLLGLS